MENAEMPTYRRIYNLYCQGCGKVASRKIVYYDELPAVPERFGPYWHNECKPTAEDELLTLQADVIAGELPPLKSLKKAELQALAEAEGLPIVDANEKLLTAAALREALQDKGYK